MTIPAIVLTYDRYKVFADHMIHSYNTNWPGHPFIFHLPFQREEVKIFFEEKYGERVKMVYANPSIRTTMDILLDEIADEEWVYWCMDDRYLIKANYQRIERIYQWLVTDAKALAIDGIKCITRLGAQLPEHLYFDKYQLASPQGETFLRRKSYLMIWIHQFIKGKVLKDLFEHIPGSLRSAKEMDYIVEQLVIPREYHLYSCRDSLMVMGESTSRGKITKNCARSLIDNGFKIPQGFSVTNKQIVSGEHVSNAKFLNFCVRYSLRKLFLLLKNARFNGLKL